MRTFKIGTITLTIILNLLFACQDSSMSFKESDYVPLSLIDSTKIESQLSGVSRKGKLRAATKLSKIYTHRSLDTFNFPIIDEASLLALQRQKRLLRLSRKKYNQRIGNLSVNRSQLNETVDILERWQHILPIGIEDELEAHQIWGKDRKGNVKFTAYFAPVISVSKRKTVLYKYPIRSKPKGFNGSLPDRRNIEQGALDTVCQTLAYAASKADIYYMQLQGSGYVQYQNGKRELFSYNGENKHPYRSIESYLADNSAAFGIRNVSMEGVKKYLRKHPHLVDSVLNQNPSYTFFMKSKTPPIGAGSVPLSPDISMAVDPRYIPLGSCFLAAVPIADEKNNVIGHDYKLLFAQDVGGAIKGAGHIDLYFGVGAEAQYKANNFNHYGRLWLLLPKQKEIILAQADLQNHNIGLVN